MLLASAARADNAPNGAIAGSGKLRRLEVMLMVTGLRCRTTQDDFQADFQSFEARHMGELNTAAHELVDDLAGHMSVADANLALDRLTVKIANEYGNGHPWLGCHELKALTERLAAQDGSAVLLEAENESQDGDGSAPNVNSQAYAPVARASVPAEPVPSRRYAREAYYSEPVARALAVADPFDGMPVMGAQEAGFLAVNDTVAEPAVMAAMPSDPAPAADVPAASDEDRGDLASPPGAPSEPMPSVSWRGNNY